MRTEQTEAPGFRYEAEPLRCHTAHSAATPDVPQHVSLPSNLGDG